jgi:guanylate kinase
MDRVFLLITGKTASGKDTAIKFIQETYGLTPVVSYTTREKRECEIDGREHWFVTMEDYGKAVSNKEDPIFAETTINNCKYWTTESQILKADMYIINPAELDAAKEKCSELGKNAKAIHISVLPELQLKRAKERDEKGYQNAIDKMKDEQAQFNTYYQYDYVIDNDNNIENFHTRLEKCLSFLLFYQNKLTR